LIVFSLKVI